MRFIKANKLFNGKSYLPDDSVLVLNNQNQLHEITSESYVSKDSIELYEGIITPGFINAHCHLELSHLKNKIQKQTGIPEFAKKIVQQRNLNVTKEYIEECAGLADAEMWNNGIVAVGDISNSNTSFKIKQNSKILYHTFVELLGLNPIHESKIFEQGALVLNELKALGMLGSLAPHAPYSTSLELIKHIAEFNHQYNLPLTIHNQETEEETKFFLGQENDFKNLYDYLQLDISWFKAPKTSSLAYYIEAFKQQNIILVHNTFSTQQDVELAVARQCFFCFCSNANLYIENKTPDFTLFKNHVSNCCIGTDSLASNTNLDLVSEANQLLNSSSAFNLEHILQMLTWNGAQALNLTNQYGTFILGKNAGLNLVNYKNENLIFIKKII